MLRKYCKNTAKILKKVLQNVLIKGPSYFARIRVDSAASAFICVWEIAGLIEKC